MHRVSTFVNIYNKNPNDNHDSSRGSSLCRNKRDPTLGGVLSELGEQSWYTLPVPLQPLPRIAESNRVTNPVTNLIMKTWGKTRCTTLTMSLQNLQQRRELF